MVWAPFSQLWLPVPTVCATDTQTKQEKLQNYLSSVNIATVVPRAACLLVDEISCGSFRAYKPALIKVLSKCHAEVRFASLQSAHRNDGDAILQGPPPQMQLEPVQERLSPASDS